jgi:hypothetical protein
MTGQLRKDEEFVIDAISRAFSGTWRSGEDPPDAYLMMDNREIAVEISILMQSRFDGRGGTVSLLSDAMSPMRLADELNDDLKSEIPDGRGVILVLKWPFSNMRAVKDHLAREICQLLSSGDSTRQLKIAGNEITIEIRSHGGPGCVTAVGTPSALPLYDVQTTACCALQERITAKAEKCRSLKFTGPVWLALLDCYRLADVETYQRAMTMFSVNHPFEKILLVSRDDSVDELFSFGA